MREAFEVIGFVGLAVLVTGWLVVSFTLPGLRRERIEWISTCGMYLALLSLFAHLCLRAIERDSHAATAAFGFLWIFFSIGLVICLTQTVASLRGRSTANRESATN